MSTFHTSVRGGLDQQDGIDYHFDKTALPFISCYPTQIACSTRSACSIWRPSLLLHIDLHARPIHFCLSQKHLQSSLAPDTSQQDRDTTLLTSRMAHLQHTNYTPDYHPVSPEEPPRERSDSYDPERKMDLAERGDVSSSSKTDPNKLTTPVFLAVLALSATYTGTHCLHHSHPPTDKYISQAPTSPATSWA